MVKIKGIAYGKYKGSKKYKLNYISGNCNGKTGFCYKNNTIGGFSFFESHEKQKEKQKQENVKNAISSFLDLDN